MPIPSPSLTAVALGADPGRVAHAGVRLEVEGSVIAAVGQALQGVCFHDAARRALPAAPAHARPADAPSVVRTRWVRVGPDRGANFHRGRGRGPENI